MAALTNKITMRLRPFCAATGLGPTKVYELIAAGEIESFTAGKARLIVVQSYYDYINRQKQNAPPIPSPNPRAGSRKPSQPIEPPRRRGRPPNKGVRRPHHSSKQAHLGAAAARAKAAPRRQHRRSPLPHKLPLAADEADAVEPDFAAAHPRVAATK